MFYFKDLKIKVGDMKREQDFSCYGFKENEEVVFQSNTRIFRVSFKHKKVIVSKNISGGAYFHHLNKILGAKLFDLTDEQLNKILEYKKEYMNELERRANEKVSHIIQLKEG